MQDNMSVKKQGIFEPPVKPRITKAMKLAVRQADQKDVLERQISDLKRRYKRDAEAKNELLKKSSEKDELRKQLVALKAEYEQAVAAKKEEICRLGGPKAEQRKLLGEQLVLLKEKYAHDIEIWNRVPEVSAQQLEKYKQDYAALEKDVKARRLQAKADYSHAVEQAKKQYHASSKNLEARTKYKVAVKYAKDKRHNTLLDLNEELRYAREQEERATKSDAWRYKKKTAAKLRAAIWRDRNLYIMLLPFIAWFIIFSYVPMYGLQIAFKDYKIFKGIWGSPWATMNGFYNFYVFFTGPYLWRLLRNTVLINIYSLIWGFPIPIILAILLNEIRNKMFKTAIQTLSYLPHFVSTVVVAGLVVNFLSPSTGLINFFYKWVTGSNEGIYFLMKPEYFRSIFIFKNIWQNAGFGAIVYVAALAGIDQELYEAARIDGAGRWKQMLNVTLPGIMSTVAIMLILRIGHLLSVGYEAIILLYQPSTYETADVISTYVYRVGLLGGNFGLSTAIGLFNGIVSFILVQSANAFSRKVSDVALW